MRKKTKLNKFLKILLTLIVSLTIFFQIIKPSAIYQKLDTFFYNSFSKLKYLVVDNPVNVIKESVTDITNLSTVYQENKVLRKNITQAHQVISMLSEAQRDNLELKQLLKLEQTISQGKKINAMVINRSSQSFNESVLINVGEKQGIKPHMAVITPTGLVGQISKVDKDSSIVKLLSSQIGNNQFAVKVEVDESTTAQALLESYNPQSNTYTVRLLNSTIAIKPGLKVVTSGLGKIIPSGLLVGEIIEITESKASFSVILKVRPSVDFMNFNYVMVVSKDD